MVSTRFIIHTSEDKNTQITVMVLHPNMHIQSTVRSLEKLLMYGIHTN